MGFNARKPVHSCLCFPHSFQEIKHIVESEGWSTVEEITLGMECGGGCGLCRPYLQRMLDTGETEFAVITLSSAD